MSLRPLPRFAHSAVVVPSSFCGKRSMVRLPHTYMHVFAACAFCNTGSSWGPCIFIMRQHSLHTHDGGPRRGQVDELYVQVLPTASRHCAPLFGEQQAQMQEIGQ